jgi:hypothetical protein
MVHANITNDGMDFLWECRFVDLSRITVGDLARVEMNAHAILCALARIDRSNLSDSLLDVYADTKANCIQVTRKCRAAARSSAPDIVAIAELYSVVRTLSVYLFGYVRPTLVPLLERNL